VKVIFISTVFPDFSIKDLSSSCLFLFPPSFLIMLVTKAVPVYHFPHVCGYAVLFLTLLKLFTAVQHSNKAVLMQHNSYLQIFLHCLFAISLFLFPFSIHHLTLLSSTPSGDIFQNINPLPALGGYLPHSQAIFLRQRRQVPRRKKGVWHLLLTHAVEEGGAQLASPTATSRLDTALEALQPCAPVL
jgi:hypothetical protein